MRTKGYTVLRVAALVCFAGAVALYTAAIALARGSWLGLFLYALAFVLAVLLPGLCLCRWALPALRGAALLPVAAMCGAAVLMLLYMLFGLAGLPALSGVLPAALGLWWVIGSWRGARRLGRKAPSFRAALGRLWRAPPALWLLLILFAGFVVMYAFTGVLDFAWPEANWHYVYAQDNLWSVGNAAAVQWGFPLRDIRFDGGVMHYHYFAEVNSGLLSLFSFQNAWDGLLYHCWPIWAGLLLAGCWALGRRLGGGPYVSLLLPLAMLFASSGNVIHVLRNPNMLAQSYVALLAAVLLALHLQSKPRPGKWQVTLLPAGLLALAMVWTKSTLGALLVAALAAAWALGCALRRRADWLGFAPIALGLIIAVLLFAVLLGGGATNVQIYVSAEAFLKTLNRFFLQDWPFGIPYTLSAVYALVRINKLPVPCIALHAMVVGGLLCYSLLHHYGGSQDYFYQAALFLAPACLLEGIAALPRAASRKVAAAAMALCMLSCVIHSSGTLVGWAKNGVGAAIRSLRMGNLIDYTNRTFSAEDQQAALWLKENMRLDEVFATNRYNRIEFGNDGIQHFYTAVSQRQCFMEGWQYALDYSVPYETYYHRRYEVVDVLFKLQTLAQAREMAARHGIDYLLVHKNTRYGVPFDGGEPVFENSDVWIYRVL